MLTLPRIVSRKKQPYVAIAESVPMRRIGPTGSKRLGEVFAWLQKRGIAPAGPPFFKYNLIDMAGELEMEFGVPVAPGVKGEGKVIAGVLPAGRYVWLTFRGPYKQLYDVTAMLIGWAKERGIRWDMNGKRFVSRVEFYTTDPRLETDPEKWETELAFKVAK